MRELLSLAIEASLEAGRRIMEIYGSEDFGVEYKSDASPLTRADIVSHEIIVEKLKSSGIPILSEEGRDLPYEERKSWDRLWIVDPIDGTKEFIKRNGEFTVNIALVEQQEPVLGVIYVPAEKVLYFASKEAGAYKLEGIEDFEELESLLKRASRLPLENTRDCYTVVASASHRTPETEEYILGLEKEYGKVDCLSRGSSLKLCMVAEGEADCYPRFAPTMEWDTAAGQAICSAVGKTVLDHKTKEPMRYNRERLLNNLFLVK